MNLFKQTTYWSIWGDCCNLHRKYFEVEEADDLAWESVLRDAKNINEKYLHLDSGKFAEALVSLVVVELESRAKLQKGER